MAFTASDLPERAGGGGEGGYKGGGGGGGGNGETRMGSGLD